MELWKRNDLLQGRWVPPPKNAEKKQGQRTENSGNERVPMDVMAFYIKRTQSSAAGRSQWPRGLRHELSSLSQTLGSCVRIALKTWMSVCVYSLCAVLCVGRGLARGWSPVQGILPTVYKLRNWKSGRRSQRLWTERDCEVPPSSLLNNCWFYVNEIICKLRNKLRSLHVNRTNKLSHFSQRVLFVLYCNTVWHIFEGTPCKDEKLCVLNKICALAIFAPSILSSIGGEGVAWLIIMGSGFDDRIYWHFFTIAVNYNSSHIELLLNDVCWICHESPTDLNLWLLTDIN
jgi:hypothetical protein